MPAQNGHCPAPGDGLAKTSAAEISAGHHLLD